MQIIISPEVPQWLLNIFNKVDFKQVGTFQKMQLMTVLKLWAKTNLTPINENKIYKKTDTKKISKDFDTDLLDLMNQYEYSNLPKDYVKDITTYLDKLIKEKLPLKEKYK